MKFNTAYDFNKNVGSQSFEKTVNEYGYKLDNLGNRIFDVIGQKDAYAEIQRDAGNTDWEVLKKYLFNTYTGGDVPGVYGDRSVEPKDLIESEQFLENMQCIYNTLPQQLKNKYNNVLELINGFSKEDLSLLEINNSAVSHSSSNNKGDGENE